MIFNIVSPLTLSRLIVFIKHALHAVEMITNADKMILFFVRIEQTNASGTYF